MRVLLTGAFGVLGVATIASLRNHGHRVRCFDRPGRQASRIARTLDGDVEVVWSDIRDPDAVRAAVADQDAVVHLAGVLPPTTEAAPELARAINVDGTRHVIAAAEASPRLPLVVFASSVSIFGPIAGREPPRRADEEPVATDHYTRHKIECEALLRASAVPWIVLRIGVALDPARPAGDVSALRMLFEVSADHRLEYVHPADVAAAIAASLECPDARRRVLLIGGGPSCRIRQHALLAAITDALGLVPLPIEAFGDGDFYMDWMDTTDSEHLLHYQRHAFEDFRRGMAHQLRWYRRLLWPVRPLVRHALLRLSGPMRRRAATTPSG